jgi:hypothetical protein
VAWASITRRCGAGFSGTPPKWSSVSGVISNRPTSPDALTRLMFGRRGAGVVFIGPLTQRVPPSILYYRHCETPMQPNACFARPWRVRLIYSLAL